MGLDPLDGVVGGREGNNVTIPITVFELGGGLRTFDFGFLAAPLPLIAVVVCDAPWTLAISTHRRVGGVRPASLVSPAVASPATNLLTRFCKSSVSMPVPLRSARCTMRLSCRRMASARPSFMVAGSLAAMGFEGRASLSHA